MFSPPDPSSLASFPLFQGLTLANLTKLHGALRGKTCPAGASVLEAEQAGEAVYIILQGSVKVYMDHEEGEHVILAILGPGQTVGEMSVADNLGHSATVTTLEESSFLWLDGATFHECLCAMPRMACNLTRILSSRLRLANEQIRLLATHDVAGRVARQMLAFAQEYGKPTAEGGIVIPLRLTQTDLAEMVGATRVHVNRVLSNFKKSGYLMEDHHHHIIIRNHDALAEHCRYRLTKHTV